MNSPSYQVNSPAGFHPFHPNMPQPQVFSIPQALPGPDVVTMGNASPYVEMDMSGRLLGSDRALGSWAAKREGSRDRENHNQGTPGFFPRFFAR